MNSFQLHLAQRGYVAKSIQRAVYCAAAYESWLKQRNLTRQEATYNDLLNYIGHLQKAGSSKSTINESLRNIRLYYAYLQLPNIAYGVKIRGETHQSLPLLTAEALEKIYHHFETRSEKGYWRYSDKLLLGLIVYQVVDTRDLYRLCIDHLIKQVKAQAQALGVDVLRFNQLRQSRLTLWIRQYGLRQAQYMAGFKRVGNVERYRQQDTEDLREYVRKYHPLG